MIYQLTPYGQTLLPIIESVRLWGERHPQRSSALPRSDAMVCSTPVSRVSEAVARWMDVKAR